jgi:hypothetical protein
MIMFMIDTQGRARISALVKAVMGWEGMTGPKTAALGRPSIATINRIKAGEEVTDTMLRAMGDRLKLPKDFLLYVGSGDVARIRNSGADPDLLRWTLDLVEADRSTNDDHRDATG